jgi:hypothetical protein
VRRKFIFQAMRGLGIDCPDLEDDPGDFAIWLSEVETLASSRKGVINPDCRA